MRRLLWLAILFGLSAPAAGDVFSYRDEDGKVHVVDQETSIPQQYRGSVAPDGSSHGAAPKRTSPGVLNAMPHQATGGTEAGSEAGEPEASIADVPPGGASMVSCTLRYVEKPSKRIDVRYTTVTYRGEIENTGTGIARTARAHLRLFSVIDGSLVDEESALLRPGDIDPGSKASFEITGNFRKTGLRNSSRDELMIDYVRCDQSSAQSLTEPGQGCLLQLVGEPQKEIDSIRKTVTYTGSVQNQGRKVAKTVQVELTSFNMRDGKPFPPVSVSTTPPRVGPGEAADFRLVAPLEFGFRDPKKDKFAVRAARCDAGADAE